MPQLTQAGLTPASDEAAVAEFVRFLETVHKHLPAQLSREALNRELQDLARSFPGDPLPVVALARLDLGTALSDATRTSVARSLQRLEVFRRATGHTPLEHLRPGVAARWIRQLAELDTEQALTALAVLSAQAGEHARTVAQFLAVARDGIPGAEADDGGPAVAPSARREFIRALAELNALRPAWDKTLETLNALAKGKHPARELDRMEVAMALSLAHLRRGQPGDGAAAWELLKPLAKRTHAPYSADLIQALISLAQRRAQAAG